MLFKSIVTGALAATILAQPLQDEHQHQHQHEKRAVKVVTQVNTVVVTAGYGAADIPTTSIALSAATDVSINTDTTITPQNQPASFSNPTTFETKTSTSAVSTASASEAIGASGAKGITYSPYSDDGGCKSASEVASDVAQLSGYDIIRIYGVDCNQAANVLAAIGDNQKIFAGIYDVSDISGGVSTLAAAVEANGGWDKVDTVSIGNELVNGGSATVSQVGSYVAEAKSALTAAGYSGSIVAVDTFIAVINNPGLCDHSDYMAVNAHAFFDGYYTADQAGDWLLQQIQRVYTACGGSKRVFITETGWPSQGDSNGKAVPSAENQKAAIQSIIDTCGSASTLFNAFNDIWKAPGAYNAEQYWGILN
ncbi:Cell surface mannoprotein mp65 [Yamadazyma tenuis]|uniref:Glycoside hydrolase n=1 Tax=Candida tenuis (strain ATCC 10573 / BCRC 21748 / CBS 615 / JCM 9827 / NBRC 10315 / NRRL Y-1498 / VKM Y-70) TaxID=590646 RepID=G3AXT0_CANTC|nr:uncharacterized protein CANTEDRAFT_118208 [Yamadazyma tenuis ATCC 10573]EGV65689.1 hypothetical protein CANTEDRAFT_118208 [Yamadazyma tenuis ATCC 10573]WEJ95998.1 Cell surface mannoprotein mp65 [Yamadazyma tenuis]